MTLLTKTAILVSASLMFLVCAVKTDAQTQSGQQQGQTQQKPIDPRINQAPPGTTNDTGDADQPPPDTHAMSGAETYGISGAGRSYFLPSAQFGEYADTNALYSGSSINLQPVTTVGGQLMYKLVRRRQEFSLEYSGGGVFYDRGIGSNYTYQQFTATEKLNWRRASVQLSDYFSYLPDSGYGAGGFGLPFAGGPPSLFGVGGAPFGLNPGFISSQSIFTSFARRFDNSSFGEFDYQLGPRSSISATGGYDLLHYFDAGLFNSHTFIFRGGYNFQATAKSSFSLIYSGSLFRYDQLPSNNFQAHSGQVGYGRRITGRLGLQISAGPQVIVPVAGNNLVSWTVNSSLRYAWERSDLALSYNHYTTNGGGLYFGSYADEFRLSGDRNLTRKWTGNASVAFARNTPILFGANPITGVDPYYSIYAGISASRPIGRYISAFTNYNFQWQNRGFCSIGFVCGPSFTRHIFGVGFNWNFRPIGSPEDVIHAISAGKAR